MEDYIKAVAHGQASKSRLTDSNLIAMIEAHSTPAMGGVGGAQIPIRCHESATKLRVLG